MVELRDGRSFPLEERRQKISFLKSQWDSYFEQHLRVHNCWITHGQTKIVYLASYLKTVNALNFKHGLPGKKRNVRQKYRNPFRIKKTIFLARNVDSIQAVRIVHGRLRSLQRNNLDCWDSIAWCLSKVQMVSCPKKGSNQQTSCIKMVTSACKTKPPQLACAFQKGNCSEY